MHYFYRIIVIRENNRRHFPREKMFLDLVLVASIASLGHYLKNDVSWLSIQTFLLLYLAIYLACILLVFTRNYQTLLKRFVIRRESRHFQMKSVHGHRPQDEV